MNYKKIDFLALIIASIIIFGAEVKACQVDLPHYKLVDLSISDIEKYVGPYIEFDLQYAPSKRIQGHMSFPVQNCHPITLEITGNMLWFFTSAIPDRYSSTPYLGEAIALTNQSITHVRLVNGTTRNGNWFFVYFGFDIDNPKESNRIWSIFQGKPLYLVCKDTSRIMNNNFCYADSAHYVDHELMNREINKHLPDTKKDCSWESQEYQEILKKLFLKKEGTYYVYGRLISNVCLLKYQRSY